MQIIGKLVRNGNSTHVAIPSRMLEWLGWLPGQQVVIEAQLDKTVVVALLLLDQPGARRQVSQTAVEAEPAKL